MQVHATLLAFAGILVVSIEAKPTWPVFVSSYQAAPVHNDVELLQYQHSPFYVYNAVLNSVPATVLTEQKSPTRHVPVYSFYYGTPVYDVGFPLTPLYPPVKPGKPQESPKESPRETTTTAKPAEEADETVEKLDTKAEPEKETKKQNETMENNEDDSIAVDAI